jgi:hypothetical protein
VNDDAVREIKRSLSNPIAVCEKLGLLNGKGSYARQGGGLLIRCPVHADRTPSCSVQAKSGVILWKCHSCDAAGDVLTLVAAVYGLTMSGEDFRRVLVAAAELGGMHSLVGEIEGSERVERSKPVPRPTPHIEAERDYPPRSEVESLWSSTRHLDDEGRVWLASRGLDADLVADLARQIPDDATLPRWASYGGKSWLETGHRVVVPMLNATGQLRSVRAIRVIDGEGPKRLPPGGFKASGLVMACEFATSMLRGTFAPKRVLIVEGEPDFLSAVAYQTRHVYARIGITSGSWTAEFASRIPPTAKVFLSTHDDAAGDKYAKAIESTLHTQTLYRWKLEVSRGRN